MLTFALCLAVRASLLHLPKESQLPFCFFNPFCFPQTNTWVFHFVDAQSLKSSGKAIWFLQDLEASCLAVAVIRPLPTVPALTECSPAGLGGESKGQIGIPLKGRFQFLTTALNLPPNPREPDPTDPISQHPRLQL